VSPPCNQYYRFTREKFMYVGQRLYREQIVVTSRYLSVNLGIRRQSSMEHPLNMTCGFQVSWFTFLLSYYSFILYIRRVS